MSTSLCTGVVKNVISRYIHNGSSVLGCFLDASKAFDMVDHGKLFHKLLERGLPPPILRFISCWYQSQQMRVKWASAPSDGFGVSNGVRQGSVLSLVLFAVYLDGLLVELSSSGVGCYWFAGSFCYADDIVLLAPCASALRCMLIICCRYAFQHANKTQLICFRKSKSCSTLPTILLSDTILEYSDEVKHLSHILSYNLDDNVDIVRAVKDMNPMANSTICSFSSVDPFVKSFLIQTYCLSLYGCVLWNLSSTNINFFVKSELYRPILIQPLSIVLLVFRYCANSSRVHGLSSSSELVSMTGFWLQNNISSTLPSHTSSHTVTM